MKQVAIGLVGVGPFVMECYVPPLLGRSDARVQAVCARNGTSAATAAATFGGGAAVYTDYRAMIDAEPLDALIVAAPDGEHHPIALAALKAGLHVLCEKPLASSLDQARELCRIAVETGRVHMINFVGRRLPGVAKIRRLVQSGALGAVCHADASWTGDYAISGYRGGFRSWWYTRSGGGGGAMPQMGIHALDLLRWLLGEVERVFADSYTLSSRSIQPENPDVANALLRFASGVPAALRTSRVDTAGPHREIRIACTGGGIGLYEREGSFRVSVRRHGGAPETLSETPVREALLGGIGAQVDSFVRAVYAGAPVDGDLFPTFVDGERAQAIAHAAEESAASGGWVSVPPP